MNKELIFIRSINELDDEITDLYNELHHYEDDYMQILEEESNNVGIININPPMVGVPCFWACLNAVNLLIVCPHFNFLRTGIRNIPSITDMLIASGDILHMVDTPIIKELIVLNEILASDSFLLTVKKL